MKNESQTKVIQYKWLASQLRSHIRAGNLKPGDRLPSGPELQREYSVNKYTIERAQKELAAEGVLVCRQGSGTFVAELRPKAPTRKGIIGLSGAGITYPAETSTYWRQLLHGIRGAAESSGNHFLLLDHRSIAGWEKVDGLLVSDQSGTFSIRKWTNHMPCVSLLAKIPGVCSVYSDDGSGIYQAVEHLIGSGHRKIAYLHGGGGRIAEQRIEGYERALITAGIGVEDNWMRPIQGVPQLSYRFDHGQQFVETGHQNMRDWLGDGWAGLGCTALLCHNDEVALGAIESLREAGFRVPEDVSVVGFDGSDPREKVRLSLSTLDVPLEEMGRKSVEILLQQIEADETQHDDCIFPVGLRLGASTTFVFHK